MLQAEQILQSRYRLKQKLGQNVGRQTWLAEDLQAQLPTLVILKLLVFSDQMQWDDLKLFEREAHILKQLDHPQIPKYQDYFSLEDRMLWFVLVQEHIPGSSLKELINQGKRFSEPEIRQIATDILRILIYLHNLLPPVLHRDIKPSNLIMDQNDQIHLVDFGAVQDRAATEGATFTVVGTYGYAPIEQFGGRSVPASDLYALGATLIHLLTGTTPADLPQKNLRIQFADRLNLNPNLVNWLEILTDPDVGKRFCSADQALRALQLSLELDFKPTSQVEIDPDLSSAIASSSFLKDTDITINKSPQELLIEIPYSRSHKIEAFKDESKGTYRITLPLRSLANEKRNYYSKTSFLSPHVKPPYWLALAAALLVTAPQLLLSYGFLVLIGSVLHNMGRSTFVYLNRSQNGFSIYKAPFPYVPQRFDGKLSDIEDIYRFCIYLNSVEHGWKVAIQTNFNRVSFGHQLNRTESVAIVREIKAWLAFSPDL